MNKGISEYTLAKHVSQAVESIVEAAENAEGFEIVVSAKAGEIPIISYKIDKHPLTPFYKSMRRDENNGN